MPGVPEHFHTLPRNAAYRYELIQGEIRLSPRPKYVHAFLVLENWTGPSVKLPAFIRIRKLQEKDWEHLPPLFRGAFSRYQPFQSLSEELIQEASENCLARTKNGADGPLLKNVCFVAYHRDQQSVLGAFLTTLTPRDRLRNFESVRQDSHEPLTSVDPPHITWVFVSNWFQRQGVAEHLLDRAVRSLRKLNYQALWSTMITANEATLLWHWKMGFRLA